jgi:hypothetical protein
LPHAGFAVRSLVERCGGVVRLVEETESHVVVGLLLILLLLLSLGLRSAASVTTGSSATSSGTAATTTAAGDGGELGRTLSDQLETNPVSVLHGRDPSRLSSCIPR